MFKNKKNEDCTEALETIYKNIEETKGKGNKSLTFKMLFPSAIKEELENNKYIVEEREIILPSGENESESIWFTTISWR